MSKGKWDHLRGKLEPKPLDDPRFAEKVDKARASYAELSLKELLGRFNEFDEEKDAANERVKEINVELAALGQLIQGQFEATDVRSVKTEFGKTIYLQVEPSVSVERRDELEAHVESTPDLQYLWSINPQQLKTYVKDLLDEALDDQIPPGVKVYSDVKVRIRKS